MTADTSKKPVVKFKSILILTALVITLITQLLYFFGNQINLGGIIDKINDDNDLVVQDIIYDNIKSINQETEKLKSFIYKNHLVRYSNGYLNLKPPQNSADMLTGFTEKLAVFSVSPKIIDSFILIGKNENQKNLYYDNQKSSFIQIPLPSQYELEQLGLSQYLYKDLGHKSAPTAEMGGLIESVKDESLKTKLKNFYGLLRDKLYVCDVSSEVIVILVIKPEYYSNHLEGFDSEYKFALYNREGSLFWSLNGGTEVKNTLREMEESKNVNQYITNAISPESETVITVRNDFFVRSEFGNYYIIVLASAGILLILAFFMIHMLSAKILQPLKSFKGIIALQTETSTLMAAPIDTAPKGRFFHRMGFRKKLFIALISSTVIPLLLLGIVFYASINKCSMNAIKNISLNTTQKYVNEIQTLFDGYGPVPTAPLIDLIKEYSETDVEYNLELINIFESRFLGNQLQLPEFSHIVVVNSLNAPVYQSIYSGDPESFSSFLQSITPALSGNDEESFFTGIPENIFGQPAIAFIKKVYSDNEQIGNLIFVLDNTVMGNFKDESESSDYVVLDRGGEIIYSGRANLYNHRFPEGEFVLEGEYAASSETLYNDWRVISFVNINYYQYKFLSILLFCLMLGVFFVLVNIFVSWILSKYLVTPFKNVKDNLSVLSTGKFERMDFQANTDEIYDIINVYNRMIDKLKFFTEENIRQKTREQELMVLKAQAEFKMLQQQINPHFLFNALETISLVSGNSGLEKISRMTKALAATLRFSLNNENYITLREEIGALKNYLLIQQIRFEDKFEIIWDVDPLLLECKMLKFVLQPIAENAISHGLYERLTGGELKISAEGDGERIRIIISDNGVGMNPDTLAALRESVYNEDTEYSESQTGSGIGLKNIYKRLRIFYKNDSEFIIESGENWGTRVILVIPAQRY